MKIQKVLFVLVAAVALALGAVALTGDKGLAPNSADTPPATMGAMGCGSHAGSAALMHPLTAEKILVSAKDEPTDAEKASVEKALKRHKVTVEQANSELLAAVGKSLKLDAKQQKSLECTIATATGTCDDDSESCGMASSEGGPSCPAAAGKKLSTEKKTCPMSGEPL